MSPVLSNSADRFKVFFACPITNYLDPLTSTLQPDYHRFVERVHRVVRDHCDEAFLALEREQWGRRILPANVCAPLDYREMQRCDLVVAYPGRSAGVTLELGWATALHKPIVLIKSASDVYSPLVDGLGDIFGSHRIWPILLPEGPIVSHLDVLVVELSAVLRQMREAWATRPRRENGAALQVPAE